MAPEPRQTSLRIDQDSAVIHLGLSTTLSATGYDDAGDTAAPDTIIWLSKDRRILLAAQTGQITAISTGSAWIVASDRRHRDSVLVQVYISPTTVHASTDATCATTTAGKTVCWGWNEVGMLGTGTFVDSPDPVLAANGDYHAALLSAGGVTCGIAGSGAHCWGYNGSGQLANGTNLSSPTPVPIPMAEVAALFLGSGATPCARALDDVMYCWGWNSYGQLLNGTFVASRQPLRLASSVALVSIASGNSHMCGLDSLQAAWCWGRNDLGQAGSDGSSLVDAPSRVSGGHAFVQLVSGADHACGRTATGEIWCWGSNMRGQLGPDGGSASFAPVRVPLPPADTLVSTRDHSCILSSADAWCWGSDAYGQLGQGNVTGMSATPRLVPGRQFRSISAGTNHTCGIADDGYAWCWGRNRYGGLGHGGYGDSPAPVRVAHQRN